MRLNGGINVHNAANSLQNRGASITSRNFILVTFQTLSHHPTPEGGFASPIPPLGWNILLGTPIPPYPHIVQHSLLPSPSPLVLDQTKCVASSTIICYV
ncbi:hypothetical protein EVAR_69686_1 [Eumeta japonica]|uniref:Uncharacterized protein n=1 Tax=Eumeta variegata TaxID=151549 RepID=A0A4C2AGM4_EUMVA|nr:hypothetical protein EVAR_69686_1 [Eumeta japonica]